MIVNKGKSRAGMALVHLFFILFSLACVIPLIAIIAISFSDEGMIAQQGYQLIPSKVNLLAYQLVFKSPWQLLNAYKISIIVTVLGTICGLYVQATMAYVLSRRSYKYRNFLAFYMFFTMLFNGGLIPSYILITSLGMKNTIWVLFVPGLVSAWNIILLRTFFQGIPESLVESAKIDGAKELRIFFSIMVPLSKPSLATIALFISVGLWNDWWNALIYITNPDLSPLQYLLHTYLMEQEQALQQAAKMPGFNIQNIPSESYQMAMCILAAGPMLFAYPFFQKYFVRGLTIGGVKG